MGNNSFPSSWDEAGKAKGAAWHLPTERPDQSRAGKLGELLYDTIHQDVLTRLTGSKTKQDKTLEFINHPLKFSNSFN